MCHSGQKLWIQVLPKSWFKAVMIRMFLSLPGTCISHLLNFVMGSFLPLDLLILWCKTKLVYMRWVWTGHAHFHRLSCIWADCPSITVTFSILFLHLATFTWVACVRQMNTTLDGSYFTHRSVIQFPSLSFKLYCLSNKFENKQSFLKWRMTTKNEQRKNLEQNKTVK